MARKAPRGRVAEACLLGSRGAGTWGDTILHFGRTGAALPRSVNEHGELGTGTVIVGKLHVTARLDRAGGRGLV
jgi:hypothetical protein